MGQSQNDPHPDPVERAEQANKAWNLKREGKTYREIGDALGCSHVTAIRLVKIAMHAVLVEGGIDVAIERAMDMERLEELIGVGFARLQAGEEYKDVVSSIVAVLNRKHKMLGMDAARKVDISSSDPTPAPEIAEEIRRLQREHAEEDANE